jgi:hypothetical protein
MTTDKGEVGCSSQPRPTMLLCDTRRSSADESAEISASRLLFLQDELLHAMVRRHFSRVQVPV